MKKILILLFVAIVACQTNKEDEIQALRDEVIGIHDEVMPKMGDLRRARKGLEALADSLMTTDSIQAMQYSSIAREIAIANESMMQWMREYEPTFEGTEKEVMDYLEKQKESIAKVKEDMEGSLAKGLEVLDKD